MNMLSRTVTARFFADADGFHALVSRWRTLVNDPASRKALTAGHYFLYAVLRGRDWRRGFSRATNAVKLANGLDPQRCPHEVLSRLHGYVGWKELFAPFSDLLHPDALERMRKLLPRTKAPLDADAYQLADALAA